MSFDFSTLITNRSASDLENLRALLSTPMEDWTAEQLAQFNQAISKGAYNYTDLNRVTACMEYLDETLRAYGYETGYQRIIVSHTGGGGSALPEGYTELEYIQSSGTQYINTGYTADYNSRVKIKIAQTNHIADWRCFIGARDGQTNLNSFALWLNSEDPSLFGYWYNSTLLTFPQSVNELGIHEADLNQNIATIDSYSVTQTYSQFSCNYPLFIFAANTAGVPNHITSAKLYYCQIYNNGTLIRNFIPAQNASGDIGLYDLANGEFYTNAGTGTFTEGPEIPSEPGEVLDPYTWYESDTPTDTQMAQYLSNVLSIWSTIMGDPTLPETMVNLTQEGANQIEQALIEINTAIEQIIAAMARSNSFTFWSGNRPFPTAYSNPGRNWAELDAMGTSWRNWQVASWYLLLYGNLEAEGDVT